MSSSGWVTSFALAGDVSLDQRLAAVGGQLDGAAVAVDEIGRARSAGG